MRFDYPTNDVLCPHFPDDKVRGYAGSTAIGLGGIAAMGLLGDDCLSGLFRNTNNVDSLEQKVNELNNQIAQIKTDAITRNTANLLYEHICNQRSCQNRPIEDSYELKTEDDRTFLRVDKHGIGSISKINNIPLQQTERKQEDMSSYIKFNGDKLPNTSFADFDDLWWYAYVAWSGNDNFGFGSNCNGVLLSKNIVFNKNEICYDTRVNDYISYNKIVKTKIFKPKEKDYLMLYGIISLQSDIEKFNEKYPSKIYGKSLFHFLLDMITDNESSIFPEVDPEKVKNIVDSIINS